jgi:hypothetical protein
MAMAKKSDEPGEPRMSKTRSNAMSLEGVQRAARVFEELQNAGHELIEMGSKQPNSDEGKQDIALGQMMRKAKDAIKDEFARITMGKW